MKKIIVVLISILLLLIGINIAAFIGNGVNFITQNVSNNQQYQSQAQMSIAPYYVYGDKMEWYYEELETKDDVIRKLNELNPVESFWTKVQRKDCRMSKNCYEIYYPKLTKK